jgi:phosphoadenosine phosphosulfate reductase
MSSAIAQYLVKNKELRLRKLFPFASEFKDKEFSTSFGQEDQVLTSLIANNDRNQYLHFRYRPFVSRDLRCFS